MNVELKDEGIRGKKMLTGKRLMFAVFGAILAGAVIAGVLFYETTYKYLPYYIDINSDLGKAATKIAQDVAINEGYSSDDFILHSIKAQAIKMNTDGTDYDILRLGVTFSENDVYRNNTIFTNHPIKDGEITNIQFDTQIGDRRSPWTPSNVQLPIRYYTITIQNSTIEASLNGEKKVRIINPVIVEMSAEENKKQIDLINGDIYSYGGTNLTYDTDILVLFNQYGTQEPIYFMKFFEVVMDIVENNATITGITKYEGFSEHNDGYSISRTVEERKSYFGFLKTLPIKPGN